ncbi:MULTISPECIES: substrate-binding and VWA domain-containing protein [unclassified Streptomyces]|uniref:substrate-binding and VWA domain-containing protein n=1 Tax=unclassified Streptomyces TaxID=2593676 RepID=UPI00225A721A|nr:MULTISPECIES: substrate-binding and VWA domain-containing protein [unclassified Streptomyces]MCX4992412.1 substrate-binding and VWA domain-containing protein [Streptomyces sp. NBC_00568]MCX5002351.1 substrate-binding and VWA domain-containing protein [Streptomyces sp. NBC_00638]
MGRHSLPDAHRAGTADPRTRARRRNVAVATALVLTVAGGAAAAVRGGLLSFEGSCQDDAVHIEVVASPDIAPALRATAEDAREKNITSDGRCLDVRVRARESYKVADELRSGKKTDAQVWVPDSGVWVQRVAESSTATQVTGAGNVASSPIGVAMVPSAAKALGWPRKTYTWTELAGSTTADEALRLGTADPAHSSTGLLALTRLSAAAARGKGGDTQAAAMAKTLSRRTSDSDTQVLDTLLRDSSGTGRSDAGRNQALILSEQAAFTHNASRSAGAGLDLFYPEDGAPLLDYPYTLVDNPGLSTDESRAALRFMTLLEEPAPRQFLRLFGFRTDAENPSDTLVTEAGGSSPQPYARVLTGPSSAEAVQEALGMWTITVENARMTTVVDASASMSELVPGSDRSRMEVTRTALLQALATFTPEDEIGLWKFSTKLDGDKDYRVLVPTGRLGDGKGAATQHAKLSAAFRSLKPVPDGDTGLYDTTLAAYKAAVASYAKGRFNAVVVLTDGVNKDPGSISRSELVAELRKLADPERPVALIAIAVGPDTDKREVDQIAKATGGSGQRVNEPSQIHSAMLKAIVAAGANNPT